ncbi:MAG UNVERIFIED_CONTAM: hypothetical protein LVT10_22475 [Anaerolineae bacterium]|jgi:hypothetical protein
MSKRILITPRSFRQMTGTHQDLLRQAGYELVNSPYFAPRYRHRVGGVGGG